MTERGRAKHRQPLVELIMFEAMTSAPMQAFATHLISEDKVKAQSFFKNSTKSLAEMSTMATVSDI